MTRHAKRLRRRAVPTPTRHGPTPLARQWALALPAIVECPTARNGTFSISESWASPGGRAASLCPRNTSLRSRGRLKSNLDTALHRCNILLVIRPERGADAHLGRLSGRARRRSFLCRSTLKPLHLLAASVPTGRTPVTMFVNSLRELGQPPSTRFCARSTHRRSSLLQSDCGAPLRLATLTWLSSLSSHRGLDACARRRREDPTVPPRWTPPPEPCRDEPDEGRGALRETYHGTNQPSPDHPEGQQRIPRALVCRCRVRAFLGGVRRGWRPGLHSRARLRPEAR
jgi:hypothetical protein